MTGLTRICSCIINETALCVKLRILHECSCFIEFIKQVEEKVKCKACRAFDLFFATSLINSLILKHEFRFYLSYDIKITLKSHFCLKNFIILSLCTQRCYGHHNVSQKSVNH